MHQARKAAIRLPKKAGDHLSVSLIAFDQEHHTGQTLFPQQFSNLTGFPNFLLLQGIEKSDFSGPQTGPKTLAKTGLATEGPSSRTCVDTNVRRVWRTSACGAAKPWRPSGMENFSRVPAETIETLAIFRLVTKIADKTFFARVETPCVHGAQVIFDYV